MNRADIQLEALQHSKLHNNLILEFATSIGKSFTAIQIIELHGGFWNIVIAETNHEQNWIDEFKKHNKEHLLSNVRFFCYQSLHKYLDDENYILDEVHHIFSLRRLNLLTQLKDSNLKRFIGLSATLTRPQKETLKNILGNYFIHKVSLSEAIDEGILPEPVIYFVGVELDNIQKKHTFQFNKLRSMQCTELEMYKKMSQRVDYLKDKYMESRVEYEKIKWLKCANDRKKFLSTCKTKHAQTLLNILKDKRLLCFTGSIEQSEQLSKGLSIHSKLSKEARAKLISDFNNGSIDKLFATQMLKEGINLRNIEIGLIIQLDNVERYLIQVLGRAMRSIAPVQYILYVKNTQDEKYVYNVIENFNKDYIKFVDLKDLKI